MRTSRSANRVCTLSTVQVSPRERSTPSSDSTVRLDSSSTLDFEEPDTNDRLNNQLAGSRKRKGMTPEVAQSNEYSAKKPAVSRSDKVIFTWNGHDASTSNFIVFDSAAGAKLKNRRKTFTSEKRKEVAAVRQRGACFKCKMWRKKARCPCFDDDFADC